MKIDHNGSSSSSHIQQQHGPPTTTTSSFSIESIEASIQSLTRSWHRRQQWQKFFFFNNNYSTQFQDLNRAPWRTHLANFLDSAPIHAISILLLIVDLVFTILELSSSLLTCRCSYKTPNKSKSNIEETWYHWVGIAILALLSAKTVAQAVGLGMCAFFRRPGYVVDGVVLIGALVLEAFFDRKGGGLLVVVSLWRVVRVVESAFELSDEAIEAQIQSVLCQFEMLKEENRKLLETISDKDKIIQKLQEDLDQYCSHACFPSSSPYATGLS